MDYITLSDIENMQNIYSQTCIKRSLLGQGETGLKLVENKPHLKNGSYELYVPL
jgi:hypothetical protein